MNVHRPTYSSDLINLERLPKEDKHRNLAGTSVWTRFSHSAHVASDLIKKLLMVTVLYRDNVYVDITVLNWCDIPHLMVPFQLMERALSP